MNNDIIRGYVILAMESLNFPMDVINAVVNELYTQFDTITEYEAQQYYLSGDWKKVGDSNAI